MRVKKRGRGILFKLTALGCIAILIPLLCAVINFLVNTRLMKNKIEQISDFMLTNVQNTIDGKLGSILNTANYYLTDTDFNMYALGVEAQDQFLKNVQECYGLLYLSAIANSEQEIMIYLPEKNYIIDSSTANDVSHIYRSLVMQKKITITQEEWCKLLMEGQNNGFVVSDIYTYGNCGRESLVYKVPLLHANRNMQGYLFVSVPSGFIDEAMDTEANRDNTILIMDGDYNIIGQYGVELELAESDLQIIGSSGRTSFQAAGESYVGTYITSEVNSWIYVFCMPEKLYMAEVATNRNLNLLVIFAGGILGILAVIFMQRNNYRPVKELIDILPEKEEGFTEDEFKQIEYNLHRIYNENRSMQNSIESRREYDKEQWLISVLKGKKNFFQKMSVEELLGEDYRRKHFCLVTFKVNVDENKYRTGLMIDDELLSFVLENIIRDILGEQYSYVRTAGDDSFVYLFIIEEGKPLEQWQDISWQKLQWLTEFFENRLDAELTTTIGKVFDDFECMESEYVSLQAANEQRYYTAPYGVMEVGLIQEVDCSMAEHLTYYNKRIKELVARIDFKGIQEVSSQLFTELEEKVRSFNVTLYYVLSVVNNVLVSTQTMVQDELVRNDAVEEILIKLRQAESLGAMKENYYQFFRLLCRVVDEDNRDSGRISDKIKRYVTENYMDCNMNISMIADAIGITSRYMSKMFQEQTGQSLLGYINNVRIEQAKILLKNTSKTVDEIAEETGFGNSRTFRRNFQKATGITASNFRNL